MFLLKTNLLLNQISSKSINGHLEESVTCHFSLSLIGFLLKYFGRGQRQSMSSENQDFDRKLFFFVLEFCVFHCIQFLN